MNQFLIFICYLMIFFNDFINFTIKYSKETQFFIGMKNKTIVKLIHI